MIDETSKSNVPLNTSRAPLTAVAAVAAAQTFRACQFAHVMANVVDCRWHTHMIETEYFSLLPIVVAELLCEEWVEVIFSTHRPRCAFATAMPSP